MNIAAPFIARPIATALLTIGLTVIGLIAYALLPIAGVPQVDIPTIQVAADLPGASAETMALSVAAPLEKELGLISGVTSLPPPCNGGALPTSYAPNLKRGKKKP